MALQEHSANLTDDVAAAKYDCEGLISHALAGRFANASAASLYATPGRCRALQRGVIDRDFCFFRLAKPYA